MIQLKLNTTDKGYEVYDQDGLIIRFRRRAEATLFILIQGLKHAQNAT